ncbi:hypothetical protein K402DRAFT_389297 [Aulographum hederae CBS 113979]|uniref:Uncharacterized protein n=1 Tax=Aulographum hederae CBS 113979 TaxID=1176131 RepID=A0A6G1HD66_9PEZI|nr:hypothetical protein K402DRAFT_389297 [Aulographum hederae CBS 113979]
MAPNSNLLSTTIVVVQWLNSIIVTCTMIGAMRSQAGILRKLNIAQGSSFAIPPPSTCTRGSAMRKLSHERPEH